MWYKITSGLESKITSGFEYKSPAALSNPSRGSFFFFIMVVLGRFNIQPSSTYYTSCCL